MVRREDGQAMILVALLLPLLVGVLRVVVLAGEVSTEHGRAQAAADAAALAGAALLPDADAAVAEACRYANANDGDVMHVNVADGELDITVSRDVDTWPLRRRVTATAAAAPNGPDAATLTK